MNKKPAPIRTTAIKFSPQQGKIKPTGKSNLFDLVRAAQNPPKRGPIELTNLARVIRPDEQGVIKPSQGPIKPRQIGRLKLRLREPLQGLIKPRGIDKHTQGRIKPLPEQFGI